MFDRGRSGQYLYFSLVSAISGNIVTGASGAISGRRSLDGGSLSLLSGFVTEVSSGQGQYVANLFAEDVTGNCIGFLFTASGCVPVNYSVITQQNVSGKIYAASGVNATVPIASISGVNSVATVASGTLFLASGNTVAVFSGTQVIIASGTQITLASGAMSGQFVTLLSGYSYIASGISVTASVGSGLFVTVPINTISGTNAVVPPANLSGVFASVPIATISGVNSVASVTSGNTYLASGSIFLNTFASGVVGGGSGNLPSSWGGSGAVTVGQNLDKSGYTVVAISGTVFPASGAFVTVPIASISGVNAIVPPANLSGVFASVPISTISGVSVVTASGAIYPASGTAGAIASGTVFLASGQSVQVLSGAIVSLLSGFSYTASGINTVTPPSSISGVNSIVPPANLSGVFSTVPITTISGTNTVVPIASISGVNAVTTIASGTVYLASGQSVQVTSGTFVTVPIDTISGVNAVIASGSSYLASGQSVAVNSGQVVALYSGQSVAVWSGTNVNVFSGTVSLTSGEVFVRIPQGVLTRDFTAFSGLVASGVSGRCVVNAERKLVNKWSLTVTSGYLTVYQENDSAVAYTQALTVASGAAPITSMDTD